MEVPASITSGSLVREIDMVAASCRPARGRAIRKNYEWLARVLLTMLAARSATSSAERSSQEPGMSDAVVKLPDDAANTGPQLDNESVTDAPGTPKPLRERVQVAGKLLAEVAAVTDSTPAGTEQALVVRPIAGAGIQPIFAAALPLPAGAATQATQASILATLGATLDVDATGSTVAISGTVPVSIAAAVPVNDNAGSLTIDTPQLPAALGGAGGVKVEVVAGGGGGGGTEYTEGDTDATITGQAMLWEDAADTLRTVSAAKPLPVGDGGGSLTVDGSVAVSSSALPAGAATEATVAAIKTGTDKIPASPATDRATAAAPASVRLSDGAAFYKGTTPADTQPVSIAAAVPVTDNAGSLTVDDGAGSLTVDSAQLPAALVGGRLSVDVGASALPTGAALDATVAALAVADNAAFTDGTTKVQPAGFILDEVAGTALTENDAAAARIDSKRAQVLTLEDATTRGQRAAVSAAGAVKVDGSAVTQPVSVAAPVPVTDNAGSLTVDSPQMPAALAAGGGIKVEGVAGGVAQPVSGTVAVSSSPASARTTDSMAAALQTDALMNGLTALTPKFATLNLTATGDVITAVGGKKLRVLAAVVNVNLDGTFGFRDNVTLFGAAWTLRQGGGFVLPFNPLGWFETTSGNKLSAALATITQACGFIVYAEV
jgi:hypothetical protein